MVAAKSQGHRARGQGRVKSAQIYFQSVDKGTGERVSPEKFEKSRLGRDLCRKAVDDFDEVSEMGSFSAECRLTST
jgi:hypothetical protein